MTDFVKLVVSHLVDQPEELSVKELTGNAETVVEISVAQEDKGYVIGKKGALINALRDVSRCAFGKPDKRLMIEVV